MIEISILDFNPVGSLEFYAKQTWADFQLGKPVSYVGNVYWRDKDSPAGFGPFPGVSQALEHFKRVTSEFKLESQHHTPPAAKPVETLPENVIKADFKNKKKR